MRELLLLLGLAAPDMTARVAAEAAVTINQPLPDAPVKNECCGQCKNGVITHGDKHTTPCPCPTSCACKTKKPAAQPCVSGTCAVRR